MFFQGKSWASRDYSQAESCQRRGSGLHWGEEFLVFSSLKAVLWIRITLVWIRIQIFTPMRIRILNFFFTRIRIRLFTLIWIWIQILASKPSWKSAQIDSYSIHFGLSSANWCGSGSESNLSLWCGSGFGFLFDADADPGYQKVSDPQHYLKDYHRMPKEIYFTTSCKKWS
jgi:hypothetical protein